MRIGPLLGEALSGGAGSPRDKALLGPVPVGFAGAFSPLSGSLACETFYLEVKWVVIAFPVDTRALIEAP